MSKVARFNAVLACSLGMVLLPPPGTLRAQAPSHSRAAPDFVGSEDMPASEAAALIEGFGLTKEDLLGRTAEESIGFAIYDRKGRRFVSSFNLDRPFNLASTTKVFTMTVVGQAFAARPQLSQYRPSFVSILRKSLNPGASQWLLLSHDRRLGRPFDLAGRMRSAPGNCYGRPERARLQMAEEAEAAAVFFQEHRSRYAIDWSGAQIADGAGCERGLWLGHGDRMTPRQYLTVLDAFRQQDFGGRNAFELMPQRSPDGVVLSQSVPLAAALRDGVIAWKTGTDAAGIKNIVGYIPEGDDPFAYYYILFVNSGRSPAESGLIHGKTVVEGFSAWAARTARKLSRP